MECKITQKGREYCGTLNSTRTGNICQSWALQDPHEHVIFPSGNVGDAKNYCRNPDDSAGPWCYTTNENVRWEYCNVSLCGEQFQLTIILM